MWGAALTAGLGALAGAQGNSSTGTSRVNLAPEGSTEALGRGAVESTLPGLQGLVNMGPGQQSIMQSNASQQQLSSLLQQYSQGGYMPTQQDTQMANQYAQTAFQPQQVAMNQSFEEEKQRASQLAAQLGRPVNDPIIQARLSQERMRGQERLGAQQSAFASEFAMSQPQQRLGYTAQLADIQSGLASQAMQNRQALIGLGSQLQGQGMQFRSGTATRTQEQSGGGGLAGAISGGLAGFGAGQQLSQMFGGAAKTLGSAGGSSGGYLGTGDLNADFGFSSPAAPSQSSIFGQLGQSASGLASQIGSFASAAPGQQSTYRGPMSPIAPIPETQGFGGFGMLNSNNMGPLAPYRPNPYGSTYGITPR